MQYGNFFSNGRQTLLIILGVIISTLHINLFYYSYDAPKWSAFDIGLSLFVFFSVLKSRTYEINLGLLGIFNIVILALMAASLFWAVNPYAGIEWLVRYSMASLLIIVLVSNYNQEDIKNLVLKTVTFSALAFIILHVIERFAFSVPRNVGAFSPIGFQNNSGQVFNIWIPLLTYLFLSNFKKPIAFLYLGLLIAVVFSLIEAATRGSIIGLLLGEILIFLVLVKKEKKEALRFLSISSLVIITTILSQQIEFLKSEILASKLRHMQSNISASSGNRLPMFKNTWEMTLQNPIGVGTNNFEYIHPKYARVGQKGKNSPFINDKSILRTPHNYPLKIFSEIGVIGGTLTLFLYIIIFVKGLTNALKGDSFDKWLLVSLVAVCFHSLVSGVFLNPASLFFSSLLIALIVKRGNTTNSGHLSFCIKKPLIIQVMFVPILSLVWLSSHAYAYQGRKNGDIDRLEQALRLNPGNERAWYDLSKLQYQRYRDIDGSLDSISRFVELYPYHINALHIKAQREYMRGKFHDANYTVERLLTIHPTFQPAKTLRARIHKALNSIQTRHKIQNGK